MTEPKRNEIISRWRAGSSIRKIAREMGLARNTVSRVLEEIEAQRAGHESSPIRRRRSRLDPFEQIIQELLGRYPDLTAVRLLEELRKASRADIPWSVGGSPRCVPARLRVRWSASRRRQVPRLRWIIPSTTSTSPARASAA
jgi:DNA-binding transcriptional MocR family regulator